MLKFFWYCVSRTQAALLQSRGLREGRALFMDQCGRIRLILQENGLKQKELAAQLGVSEGYISKLLRDPDIGISQTLAALAEEKYGYSARWLLTGQGPKLRAGGVRELSELHRRAIARLERLDERQVRAVLAFIRSLEEVEGLFGGEEGR